MGSRTGGFAVGGWGGRAGAGAPSGLFPEAAPHNSVWRGPRDAVGSDLARSFTEGPGFVGKSVKLCFSESVCDVYSFFFFFIFSLFKFLFKFQLVNCDVYSNHPLSPLPDLLADGPHIPP